MEFSMIVLAGGKSSRMGRDKSDLLLGMDTFLNVQIRKGTELGIRDILVSGYRGEDCPVPVIRDRLEGRGPLGGLEACCGAPSMIKCWCWEWTSHWSRLPN